MENQVFAIASEEEFNFKALETFSYQFQHLPVYRQFCKALGRTQPKNYKEIPFLPIAFFKSHTVLSEEITNENLLLFKSSGTTQSVRSNHWVAYPELYKMSFLKTFTQQITSPGKAIIFALLPNYIEQGNSSLVYMVETLIQQSQHPLSGFYLKNYKALIANIKAAKNENKKIVLFGVSYALLDLAEMQVDLSDVIVIETGGMKGRRKEMIKSELHETLCKGFHVPHVYSEYGMTELLSQAYLNPSGFFTPPPWMKILIRDINDPFLLKENKTGGINVIDLANRYSCAFIATDDLGKLHQDNSKFQVLGRFDQSDMRGCNLLVQ